MYQPESCDNSCGTVCDRSLPGCIVCHAKMCRKCHGVFRPNICARCEDPASEIMVKDPESASNALTCINLIRQNVLDSISSAQAMNEEHDPWDEFEQGSGWVENEVSLFVQLLMCTEIVLYDLTNSPRMENTVADCQLVLERQNARVLEWLIKLLNNGGSANAEFFDWRDSGDVKRFGSFFEL